MKLDKADQIFSKYIRTRDNWTCQYCHKKYPEGSQGIHNSHYWSRTHESTRYDPDNCLALCFYHHQLLGHGEGRDEYKKLMLKKLGKKRYDMLEWKAHQYKKKDRKLDYLIWKKAYEQLQSENNRSL